MRATIAITGALGDYVTRVNVINKGPKRARIELLAKAKLPQKGTDGRWVKAGARTYVPTDCLRFNGK